MQMPAKIGQLKLAKLFRTNCSVTTHENSILLKADFKKEKMAFHDILTQIFNNF